MDINECVQLLVPLGSVAALWLRMEHRLTRVEDKVKERYSEKKTLLERLDKIEKWLPKQLHDPTK
jgi:hypothetical protein